MGFITGVFGLLFWVAIIFLVVAFFSFNKLQRLAQEIREAASNVQIAISKKLSLINQLIDVVKNHQEYEQFTHLKISQDTSAPNLMAAYQQSGTVLAALQGFIERFPNLKTSGQYHRLVDSIQQCESEIQQSRQKYNFAVKNYNSVCLSLPTVLIARFIGFSQAPYLEFDVSGLKDVTDLKEFKTADGERIQQLLHNAGTQIAGSIRGMTSQAGQTGELLATMATGARCRGCGQPLSSDGNFCQYCGTAANMGPETGAIGKCSVCGTDHVPGAKFCTQCGQVV